MTADPPEDPRAATAPGRPPAGRYGPDRAARPGWVPVLLGATLVAAIVLAAWLGLRTGSVPIEGHDVGFRVLGDDAVVVTFDVTRAEPGRAATCRIEALNGQSRPGGRHRRRRGLRRARAGASLGDGAHVGARGERDSDQVPGGRLTRPARCLSSALWYH